MLAKKDVVNKKLIIGLTIGSLLEFFDFSIFAFSLGRIAELFFPSQEEFTSYILVFLTFALGFLSRPIGAIIFGYLGDLYGRKFSFTLSLFLMGLCSVLLGLLPTYSSIGLFSTIMLTICRLIQGMCIGGEYTGALIIAAEKIANNQHRSLWSGIISSCGIFGWFVGMGVIMLSDLLVPYEYSWRVPFIVGGLTAIVGIYIRKSTMTDENIFLKPSIKKVNIELSKMPIIEFFTVFFIGTLVGIIFYSQYVFFNTFLPHIGIVDKITSQSITTVGLFVYMVVLPIAGFHVDKRNHTKSILFVLLLIIFLSTFFYNLFFTGTIIMMYALQILITILLAYFVAPATFFMTSLFDTKIKYTCVSLAYNLGVSIFGGFTPTIMLLIHTLTDNPIYLTLYLLIPALVCFILIYNVSKKIQN